MRQVNNSSSSRPMSEAHLTRHVNNWLRGQTDVWHYKASDRYTKGIPDIIACVNGIFVGIELKAANGTPTPHQLQRIKNIVDAGGVAGVCYSLADAKKLVDEAIAKSCR